MPEVSAIVFAFIGATMAITALCLVSAWANLHNGPDDQGWLGPPNWNYQSVFGWHPVLMVAGFFFSQIFTVLTWTFFPDSMALAQKAVFWFWQLAALATFIGAMCAVVKYKLNNKYDALTTIHSWIGVIAITVFLSNFLWGFLVHFVTPFTNAYGVKFDLIYIHKARTILCLIFTYACIITGIVNKFGADGCNYVNRGDGHDTNPAVWYDHIPDSCKTAFGMGLATTFATMTAVIAVCISGFNPYNYKPVDPEGKE